MAKITITMNTDNSAFEEDFVGEFKRILSEVYPTDGDVLVDSNGNTVGRVKIERNEV